MATETDPTPTPALSPSSFSLRARFVRRESRKGKPVLVSRVEVVARNIPFTEALSRRDALLTGCPWCTGAWVKSVSGVEFSV